MTRILIGIPCAKYIESETFQSIYNLETPKGCTTDFQYFYGYNVAQVRNLMANYMILGRYDYMLWVDSDIVLPTDTLVKLYNLDKDIASGVYIQRIPGTRVPEIYIPTSDNRMMNCPIEQLQEDKIMQVVGCGFGCVLTSRKVLEDIGYPQFEYHNALDHKQTLSEDVDFCIKALNKGYKIYTDTSIKCKHIGNTYFTV